MRWYLDSIDWSAPDAVRSLRAAVGATAQRALSSTKAWNAQRARSPRLPEASVVGIGGGGEDGDGRTPRRRRRRRRLQTAAVDEMPVSPNGDQPDGKATTPDATGDQTQPARKRRRRRRRRKPVSDGAAVSPNGAVDSDPADQNGDSRERESRETVTPSVVASPDE
jgi:hypothetical protein